MELDTSKMNTSAGQ
jgi:ribosomal protein S17E